MSAGQEAAAVVRERAPGLQPRVGVVLGSGLGAVVDALTDRVRTGVTTCSGVEPS